MITEPLRMIWNALKIWWDVWVGLWLFGLVWVLCWATLVLGPPATFGFFHGVRWLMVEKEIRWEHYIQPAKTYFVASWLWFLANLLVLYIVFSNYVYYSGITIDAGYILKWLAVGVGILWIAVQFYALPYYVLLEKKSLLIAWKNGLFTLLASPIFSLVLWIVLAAVLFLHVMIFPIFLAGPGLLVLLVTLAVEDRIQKFGIRERDASKDTTN